MRFPDWPSRLSRFIEANRNRPFRWGDFDCCLFAADAVRSMTGRDFGAGFRGTYYTAHGAARLWMPTGFYRFIASITESAGLREIDPRMARRGDVVLILEDRQTLGVVTLSADAVWCVTPQGMIELPMRLIHNTWQV